MGWPEVAGSVAGARADLQNAAMAARAAQERLLQEILRRHAASEPGRRHGFAGLDNLAAYRQAVPPADYESIAPQIAAMAAGDSRVLVDEPVVAFERTGGSSGGAKLIPLTASGLSYLQRGLYAWLDDLCTARPAVMAGSSYWSISPAGRAEQKTAGGLRIGLSSDAEYFGAVAGHLAGVLSVSPAVAALTSVEGWRTMTLQILLADPDLALVSVWSPTFWTELCRHAIVLRDVLVEAVATGRWAWSPPADIAPRVTAPHADPQRARILEAALAASTPDWHAVWPRLALISCWSHASSNPWATRLAQQFPHSALQGKGLLATEGIVSLPLCDGGDPVAAVTSTVLEFEDDAGRTHACDEVRIGGEYDVLMTTSAGLYRYRLGDRIRVTGFWHGAPRILLLGRATTDSDLCGEKLTEAFVVRCWAALGGATGRLVPRASPAAGYLLAVDALEHDTVAATRLAARLDEALRANPQYAYARDLGQLAPVTARRVERLAARLEAIGAARGQRLGDTKPAVLGRCGEAEAFE